MVDYVKGSELPADLRRQALAAYVHRYTRDHVPAWARQPRPDGRPCPVHFASDADWLAHTWFPVTAKGALSNCPSAYRSYPTFPDNPEFRTQQQEG